MSVETIASSQSDGVTFDVSDVPIAEGLLPFAKTQVALRSLVKGEIEAVSDYTDDCLTGISTNPLITAAKIAYETHRPLVLSPDVIWLTICQGLSMHIEENWAEYREQVLINPELGRQHLITSTEEFPFGSPETPWNELIDEVSEQACSHVRSEFSDLFRLSFSTTGGAERTAMNLTFLSAVDQELEIYDFDRVCGIPQLTLRGTLHDWQALLERLPVLDRFGLTWWTNAIVPICQQFVAAFKGTVDAEFWQRLYTTRPGACHGDLGVTGWIGTFFPYRTAALNARRGLYKSTQITHPGLPGPGVEDFVLSLRSVQFVGPRSASVELVGGLIGISQDPQTMALSPKVGYFIRRVSPFKQCIARIRKSSHCEWTQGELVDRQWMYISRCASHTEFYRALNHLVISPRHRQWMCRFPPMEELEDIRKGSRAVYQVATFSDGGWIGAVRASTMEDMERGSRPKFAYFWGEESSRAVGAKCHLIAMRLEDVLNALLSAAARGDDRFVMEPLQIIDPQSRELPQIVQSLSHAPAQ
ncbi:MAG: DUF4419 domain-containing protein [Planctomycetaceae bacterium]